MKEYNLIVRFLYKNKKYQLLTDTDDKYFFLEIKNNQYSYITLEEFVELCNIFCKYPSSMNIIKDGHKKTKMKIIPKIIIGGMATILTVSSIPIIGAMSTYARINRNYDNSNSSSYYSNDDISNHNVQSNISFVVDDYEEQLVIDTLINNDYSNCIYIYDMEYLDEYLDYDNVSKKQLYEAVNDNSNINDRFKLLILEFIDSLYNKYNNIDLRVLYENLKTLKIIECDKNQLLMKTFSMDSCACYVRMENTIYTLKDYEYKKGTWEYQVIMHEFAHTIRNGWFKHNDKELRVSATGNSLSLVTVDEALNSVFTVSLFDYEERDIAYQLQSNYCTIMLECLDNYSLSDYINHSLSYYASKLDEHNGDNNYAKCILTLIDTQYKDFHSDQIEIEQEEYYPIYDYIASMYYKKYINSNMSYDEAKVVADDLVERITYDVPEEYNIDINKFYDYLNEYCNSIGIEVNINSKSH